MFDPYFTTKMVSKGTGMGLALVNGIVQSYGGAITCDSLLGGGSIFHIALPTVVGFFISGGCTISAYLGRERAHLADRR